MERPEEDARKRNGNSNERDIVPWQCGKFFSEKFADEISSTYCCSVDLVEGRC